MRVSGIDVFGLGWLVGGIDRGDVPMLLAGGG